MKNIFFIFCIVLLGACSSKKEIASIESMPRPNWVGSKPLDNNYYAGIGMAYKSAGADYIAIAKNNALNDLASEISVNVSSSSLFYQVEQDQNLREEFQANTRLKSKENLAGYELVGNFENTNEYWVYYALDKSKYEIIKQERLAAAIAQSKQLFNYAHQFRESNQYAESLKFTVKAIAALKDHMAEPVQTEWNGKEVFLLVELYSFYQQTFSDILILPVTPKIESKRGKSISADKLAFVVSNQKGVRLSAIPMYLYYSGTRINNNQLYTDNNGLVSYTIQKLTSKNSKEYFQANINMVSLVSEATEDPFIRKLLAKVSGGESRIEISLVKPNIFIISEEKNLNEDLSNQLLANAFKQSFIAEEFEIATNRNSADYILKIISNTKEGQMQQKFFTASLDANFQMTDVDGSLLYEKQITGFTGMQLSQEKAGEDAYRKLAAEIQKRYFREMRRKIFD